MADENMHILQLADAVRYQTMTTAELRSTFVIGDLFKPDALCFRYIDLDRTIVGSAVPLSMPIVLPTYDPLRARYFTERREIGILNIGGPGRISVEREVFDLAHLDALYIGRGNEHIRFESSDSLRPAEFYLLSYPAHTPHPTRLIQSAELPRVSVGSSETANRREIIKLIHAGSVSSCQLVMGFTQLASGSVWNTMPPHTHMRRSEVYLYFDLGEGQRVVHLMGPATETRSLIVANKQVVVSPGWSIHAGVGTSSYTFCWGMGGENQDYDDMDRLTIGELL